MTPSRVTLASILLACLFHSSPTSASQETASLHRVLNSTSNFDPRRSGYHHPDTNADGQKENQFSSNSGFVPIAKPLIQDIYDISSSERNANHLHHHQDPDNSSSANADSGPDHQYHRYFPTQPTYDGPKSEDVYRDYGHSQAHQVDHYYDESRARPEATATRHNYFKVPMNQDSDVGKFMSHQDKFPSNGNNEEPQSDLQPETDSFQKNPPNYMANKPRPSYSMYNDENSMMHPDSAVHLLKNIAQPSEYPQNNMNGMNNMNNMNEQQTSSADQEMQNLLSQFSNSNMAMKPNEPNVPSMPQDFPSSNMNEFAPFSENMASSPISDISGIAGFQPAPEGGQLPAPPGYKHVGYITIPAGAANLPNMVSQPNNGLPLIRPIPINSAELGKLNKNKQDSKKGHDNKASESKPVRSFLSRLNPLNMLRRLRQRRERRQTSDISSNEYLPLSGKYTPNYGYGGMPNSYQMSPYGAGYSSISGLGGMSGLGAMYSGMSNPSPVYAPNYGSYSYGGYSGYPGYGYMSPAVSPYQSGGLADMKTATSGASGDMSAAASGVSPQAAASSHMPMPMMMPMPMGGYGYPGMGSMPMSSMPMAGYGYPGHSHSPMYSPSSGSSSSQSSSSGDQSNPLGGQTLPGGINLSDLLKDEEDEPSRFRKFLGYLNPMNFIKRFRNNTSEERKRVGRYKRDVQLYLVNVDGHKAPAQLQERSDESKKGSMTSDSLDIAMDNFANNTSESVKVDSEPIDEMDEILAHDSVPKVVHGRRKSPKRAKYNLMGSRNFEIIRGGTFQAEDMTPLRSSEHNEYDQTATNANGGNVLSEADEEIFDNEAPEILGFQGFNGFSSMYNALSASNQSPNFVEPAKSTSEPKAVREEQKSFQSIEHAAITSSELKAIS